MHRSPFSRILWGVLLCIGSTVHASNADRAGKQINDFSLKSHLGREYSLHDFADRKVVVVAFLGAECPLAKLYGPRLADLARQMNAKRVGFLGMDSNKRDSLRAVA